VGYMDNGMVCSTAQLVLGDENIGMARRFIDGITGVMKNKNSFETICKNIQDVVVYAKGKANLKFCTISEASNLLKFNDNLTN